MKIITDISQIDQDKLDLFIKTHPRSNFFQSLQAYWFFKEVDDYEPLLFIIIENQQITGSLLIVMIKEGTGLKAFFSRRCIIWGSPLLKNEIPELYRTLFDVIDKQISKKVIYTEFRNFEDMQNFKKSYADYNYKYNEHLNYIIKIISLEDNKSALSKSKKNQINKSIKNGAEIAEASSINEIKEFYTILKDIYGQKVKKPLPPFSFFEQFFNQDLGKYLFIKKAQKVIGGIMCPVYKDTIYEYYVCGLDGKFKNIYPSVLATWAAIEYALENNLKYFDFMGAGKPDEDYGVREFKSKFGGELVNYGRFIKVNNSVLYNMGKSVLKLKQFLNI